MSDGNFLPVGQSWTPTLRLRHPQDPQGVPLPPGPAWDTSLDVPGGMCQRLPSACLATQDRPSRLAPTGLSPEGQPRKCPHGCPQGAGATTAQMLPKNSHSLSPPAPPQPHTPPLLSPRAGWDSGTHLAGRPRAPPPLPHAPFRAHPPENPPKSPPCLPPAARAAAPARCPPLQGLAGRIHRSQSPSQIPAAAGADLGEQEPPARGCRSLRSRFRAADKGSQRRILPGRWVLT